MRTPYQTRHFEAELLRNLGVAIIATDPNGRVVYWNPYAEELYGWTELEALGRNVVDLTPVEGTEALAQEIFARLAQGEVWRGEFRVRRRDGSEFIAGVIDTPVMGPDGRLSAVVGVSADITDEWHSREALAYLAAIVTNSADGIISLSTDGTIQSWNAAAEVMFGYSEAEVLGRPVADFRTSFGPYKPGELSERARRGETLQGVEIFGVRKDGVEMPLSVTVSPVTLEDRGTVAISAIVRDISAQKQLESALEWMAYHDSMTGLSNRSQLDLWVEEACKDVEADGLAPALLMVGLDFFKVINDSLGYSIGDQILQQLAKRLLNMDGSLARVARLSGDVFVVFLDKTTMSGAEAIAKKTLAAVRAPLEVGKHQFLIDASIGVALSSYDRPGEDLLKDADIAMHAAKALGRGRYQLFDPDLMREIQRRNELATEMKGARWRGDLRLEYQPIVDLRTNRIVSVEALLRWRRGTVEVSPEEFISIAEDTGEIYEMGEFALVTALNDLKEWQSSNAELSVHVNVSALQLQRPEFATWVSSILNKCNLRPSCLTLEVTESRLMNTTNFEILRQLRDFGVRIAIDDFGTGFSSISYLASVPADTVKIDRSLLFRSASLSRELAITEAVLALVHAAGLEAVAEGIENDAQVAHLLECGVELGQGYYFHRPMSFHELSDLLQLGTHPRRAA